MGHPATPAKRLLRMAEQVRQWLESLEGEDGCGICGIGKHVARCPVPDLRHAREHLLFMAAVPEDSGGAGLQLHLGRATEHPG